MIKRRLLALGTAAVTAFGMTATSSPAYAEPTPVKKPAQTAVTNQAPIKISAPAAKGTPKTTTREMRGAPVNSRPYEVTQPDGTKLRLQNHGDNLRKWTTGPGGATVAKDASGYWK